MTLQELHEITPRAADLALRVGETVDGEESFSVVVGAFAIVCAAHILGAESEAAEEGDIDLLDLGEDINKVTQLFLAEMTYCTKRGLEGKRR